MINRLKISSKLQLLIITLCLYVVGIYVSGINVKNQTFKNIYVHKIDHANNPEKRNISQHILTKKPPLVEGNILFTVLPEAVWLPCILNIRDNIFNLPWISYVLAVLAALLSSILTYRIISRSFKRKNIFLEKTNGSAIQELYYRRLIETCTEAIVLLDETGKVLYQNPSVERITGYSFEDMLRIDGSSLIHPKYLEKDNENFSEFIQELGKEIKTTHRLKHKQGHYIWIEGLFHNLLHDKTIKAIVLTYGDITEKKNAEEKVKENEERHRAQIENLNDGIVLINKDMQVFYQSPSVERIVGFSLEDRKGKIATDFIHPDDIHLCYDQYEKAKLNPGIPFRSEYRTMNKNGYYIWIDVFIMNLLDNKNVNAYVVSYRDISDRKKAEEKLLLAASIVNSSDDAIISKTIAGTITSWNKGAENVLGYTAIEAIGKTIYLLISPEHIEEEKEISARILKGESIVHFETIRKRKDGQMINVSLTISPIVDETGKIVGASKIMRDVTEQKRAQEIIKQSESNYRQLFDLSPAPMWVLDDKTHEFIQVNKACINSYGYSKKEFLQMKFENIKQYDSAEDLINIAFKRNKSELLTMSSQQHIKKSGEIIDVDTASIPIFLNGVKRILGIAIDVTEKNLYEQKLTRASIKAQEDERFEIGGELHDNVCQILTASLMYLGLTKKNKLPPKALELLDQTKDYITLASKEIRNLSHRLAPVIFDETDLEKAFDNLLSEFNIEKKYKIGLLFDKEIKDYTLVKEVQLNLYRILQEQLRNIFKHANATAIDVELTIQNDNLQMRIADNGIGFDAKSIKSGIGLANMNRRMQLFSGSITIQSTIGKGTEILAEIPLSKLV